ELAKRNVGVEVAQIVHTYAAKSDASRHTVILSLRRRRPGQEKPVPGRRLAPEFFPAGELLPGQTHFQKAKQLPAGAAKTMANLERLPEMLLQAPIPELSKRKVIIDEFAHVGRVLAGSFDRLSAGKCAVHEQHRVIVNGVHRREDAEELSLRPERGPKR